MLGYKARQRSILNQINATFTSGLINEINEKARFERIAGKRKAPVADAEIDRFLDEHFAEHKLLQRHHIEDYFALSKRRALTILNSLVADGRLRRTPGTTACTASYVRG